MRNLGFVLLLLVTPAALFADGKNTVSYINFTNAINLEKHNMTTERARSLYGDAIPSTKTKLDSILQRVITLCGDNTHDHKINSPECTFALTWATPTIEPCLKVVITPKTRKEAYAACTAAVDKFNDWHARWLKQTPPPPPTDAPQKWIRG